jgi:hypothetical protein
VRFHHPAAPTIPSIFYLNFKLIGFATLEIQNRVFLFAIIGAFHSFKKASKMQSKNLWVLIINLTKRTVVSLFS